MQHKPCDSGTAEESSQKVVVMAKTEKKRRLFDELMEAAEDINQWREGKITLKTYTVNPQPQIEVTPEILRESGR